VVLRAGSVMRVVMMWMVRRSVDVENGYVLAVVYRSWICYVALDVKRRQLQQKVHGGSALSLRFFRV
jgi:hypothetical protein